MELDFVNDSIRALLLDLDDYTVNLAVDADLADIPSGAITSVSAALTGQTVDGGSFMTDDFEWLVVLGDESEGVAIYDDTHADDALIAYYDTGLLGMPIVPTGGTVVGSVSASSWFSL